ncbi:hypothetical protein [Maribacter sp. MAR_2009_72]|uniref:hypothetical protein n=1 Tax=Maribacter sp. MAR_2009_72 TaxID=1250050 RepID=UPI001199787F|nr:hypothetical protein [Maribacter sp. MAR_2009_72]TVZ13958.1 hypothetical protein JM81_0155 [Maribacter sp. MAR_2009_72]
MISICKRYFVIICTVLVSCYSFAQESFLVLQVDGDIRFSKSNEPVRVGDEFRGNPEFTFPKENDRVYLGSSLGGIITCFVKNKNTSKRKENGWILFLKSNFLPAKEYAASRSIKSSPLYLFFNNDSLLFDRRIRVFKIPESNKSYYLLNVEYSNTISQNRLVVGKKGIINLNKDLFLKNNTEKNDIIKNIEISFFDQFKNSKTVVNELSIKAVQMKSLIDDVTRYRDFLIKHGQDQTDIKLYLMNYINFNYGGSISLNDIPLN